LKLGKLTLNQYNKIIENITLELYGSSTIWFKDGDLFYGDSILISLDAKNNVIDVRIVG
jgi:hypothetical protein